MKTPTDILRDEHILILRGLDALEAAAQCLQSGAPAREEWWTELLAWLRGFADQNHHAKEENFLFPAMIKAGVPAEGGPIDVMLEEHEQGRALIHAMAASGGAKRAAYARKYVDLLRAHIEKENGVLFPLAETVLEEAGQIHLHHEFAKVESELGRPASFSHAEAVVGGLAAVLAPATV